MQALFPPLHAERSRCVTRHVISRRLQQFGEHVHTVTPSILNRIPRIFSLAQTPTLVAHWNPATQCSLISFMYCAPFVVSTSKFTPVVSGPKYQIFLASIMSYPYSSAGAQARALKSSRVLISLASIATMSSSLRGHRSLRSRPEHRGTLIPVLCISTGALVLPQAWANPVGL